MEIGARYARPQEGMKTVWNGAIVGSAADDGGRQRSGCWKPFVNVVRNAFGNRRVRLLPQGGKPDKERLIIFSAFFVLRQEGPNERSMPPLMRHGHSQGHRRGLYLAAGR